MDEKKFIIKRGITDNHPRQLIFNENFLKFENKDLAGNQFTIFQKDQITDYSFGVKWMIYYFIFGREYTITIKNAQSQVIKINFKTYFGRKKNEYHKLYSDIITDLWNYYFEQQANDFIRKNEAGEEFKIGEVLFIEEGIIIKTNSSIREKKALIPWEKIRTRNYATYFAIYAVDDAETTNRGYSYLNDWNTDVLYSVIRTILSKKNIETYQ